jgi:hypothetical protein
MISSDPTILPEIGQDDLDQPAPTGKPDSPTLQDLTWVGVGNGRLALYHRPGRRAVSRLKSAGCDLVVTLLKESEGGLQIGHMVQNSGLDWLWLPVQDGNPPVGDAHEAVARAVPELSRRLDQGQSILIHCAAGIHRTGMVALALLRYRGLSEDEGMQIIGQSRFFTFDGLQSRQKRYAATYASQIIEAPGGPDAEIDFHVGEPYVNC